MKIKDGILKYNFEVGDIVVCNRFVGGPGFVEDMEKFVGKAGQITSVDLQREWVTVHGWYWPMSAVKKVR